MKSISEQKRICSEATPGPWEYEPKVYNYRVFIKTAGNGEDILPNVKRPDDARFFVESRTAYPELLEWAKRARALMQETLTTENLISRYERPKFEKLLAELPE